jgi:toxin ParE1/3/4
MSVPWKIRLTQAAENDLQQIIRWTAGKYGRRQAKTYGITLTKAIEDLANGPTILGVRSLEEIGPNIHTLHVARQGRRGRHILVFRTSASTANCIEVLRVLHDAMELCRHLSV